MVLLGTLEFVPVPLVPNLNMGTNPEAGVLGAQLPSGPPVADTFHHFCDKFYVQVDIFKGQFCVTPTTIKNKDILKLKILR